MDLISHLHNLLPVFLKSVNAFSLPYPPSYFLIPLPVSSCLSLSSWLLVKVKLLSCVRLFVTPWTVAYLAPPSMGFSRQEYWSGVPFPSPGDLPDPGIEPRSPAFQADALTSEPPGEAPWLLEETSTVVQNHPL